MRARSREVLLWCSKPWPAGCKLFWQRHLPFLLLPVVHKLWWLARCKPCTSACVSVPWALASSFIQALTPCNMLVIYPGLQHFTWRQMAEVRRPPGITNIPALCSGESRLNLPDLSRGLCCTKAALLLDGARPGGSAICTSLCPSGCSCSWTQLGQYHQSSVHLSLCEWQHKYIN